MVLYLTNFALVFSFLAVGKVFLGWVVTNCLLFEAGMHLIPQLNSRLFPFLNSSVFEKQLWNVVDEVHPGTLMIGMVERPYWNGWIQQRSHEMS